ncbi:hypothetical protein K504DRAFT_502154 [Pleomassaria siparia CBS 279.74]|uniref:Uncharacterized protein n=1 Tax=Pleomassaria siparia CBS 279.74 TaxID=1314801 RepID=A0A6G1K9D7_9PLEO|nr:hypothetical protein K504DRAFT_502154 [Pleomassaria siparia CBS 279.74]
MFATTTGIWRDGIAKKHWLFYGEPEDGVFKEPGQLWIEKSPTYEAGKQLKAQRKKFQKLHHEVEGMKWRGVTVKGIWENTKGIMEIMIEIHLKLGLMNSWPSGCKTAVARGEKQTQHEKGCIGDGHPDYSETEGMVGKLTQLVGSTQLIGAEIMDWVDWSRNNVNKCQVKTLRGQ